MKKQEFYLPSSNGINHLHAICYLPEEKPIAILQVVHGMIEHIGRYEDFASFLTDRKIALIGHDHLGHGYTARNKEELGYFHIKNGSNLVIKDIHVISNYITKQYPLVPHFILGHSMGSFFTRKYLTVYQEPLQGVILMGTGSPLLIESMLGAAYCNIMTALFGSHYRSHFLHEIILGGYNRVFSPNRTSADWLSRDTNQVDCYLMDPYCNFKFTVGAYHDFFQIVGQLAAKRHFDNIPKTLPLLLVSGDHDPVGSMGKGVRKVYRQFKHLNIKDLSLQLYPGARHELLNELNKEEVYQDLYRWIIAHLHTIN